MIGEGGRPGLQHLKHFLVRQFLGGHFTRKDKFCFPIKLAKDFEHPIRERDAMIGKPPSYERLGSSKPSSPSQSRAMAPSVSSVLAR